MKAAKQRGGDCSNPCVYVDTEHWLRTHGRPPAPKLGAEQLAQLSECFQLIDTDGGGTVDAGELGAALQARPTTMLAQFAGDRQEKHTPCQNSCEIRTCTCSVLEICRCFTHKSDLLEKLLIPLASCQTPLTVPHVWLQFSTTPYPAILYPVICDLSGCLKCQWVHASLKAVPLIHSANLGKLLCSCWGSRRIELRFW